MMVFAVQPETGTKGRGKALRTPRQLQEKIVACMWGYLSRLAPEERRGVYDAVCTEIEARLAPAVQKKRSKAA